MQQLCTALCKQANLEVHFNATVEDIRVDGHVANGCFHRSDHIVCALPANIAAQLLRAPLNIRMESFEVVNLGYNSQLLPKKGYGYLVPSQEKEPLAGMIWDSAVFPYENQTKITAMVKGQNPIQTALSAMHLHLGVAQIPDATRSTRVEVPQYELGHMDKIKAFKTQIQTSHPNVGVIGNYLDGASVNACVKEGVNYGKCCQLC